MCGGISIMSAEVISWQWATTIPSTLSVSSSWFHFLLSAVRPEGLGRQAGWRAWQLRWCHCRSLEVRRCQSLLTLMCGTYVHCAINHWTSHISCRADIEFVDIALMISSVRVIKLLVHRAMRIVNITFLEIVYILIFRPSVRWRNSRFIVHLRPMDAIKQYCGHNLRLIPSNAHSDFTGVHIANRKFH